MAEQQGVLADRLALVDAVDHLLNTGAVLHGEAMLSLAGVDLVYVGLNLLVASVETLRAQAGAPSPGPSPVGRGRGAWSTGSASIDPAHGQNVRTSALVPPSGKPPLPRPTGEGPGEGADNFTLPPSLDPRYPASQTPAASMPSPSVPPTNPLDLAGERPEQGLARLVLTLVELLRQLLERQALRRAEGGGLSDEAVERMGVALMELEAKMGVLRDAFDLTPDDLTIDLGPLGRLL